MRLVIVELLELTIFSFSFAASRTDLDSDSDSDSDLLCYLLFESLVVIDWFEGRFEWLKLHRSLVVNNLEDQQQKV